MFYVIDSRSGEEIQAEGFWAIGEGGNLYDVIDGWGCEGGGGSSNAPSYALAVFGVAPSSLHVEPEKIQRAPKIYTHGCTCGARFSTYGGSIAHCNTTKQPGPHVISER